MSDDGRSSRPLVLWLLPVGLLLYLASVGPVARAVRSSGLQRDSIPGAVISIVYWPVEKLANEVAFFGELLRWYVDLFLP